MLFLSFRSAPVCVTWFVTSFAILSPNLSVGIHGKMCPKVASLSDRANEAVHTALLITHDIVQKLAEEIRAQGLDALFAVRASRKLARPQPRRS